MSQPGKKNTNNVEGAWYCTHPEDPSGNGCSACAVCYSNASDYFAADADGYAYVKKQPVGADEIALCQEQLEACPVGSIGSNG